MSILAHAPKWDRLRSTTALNGALPNRDALAKDVPTPPYNWRDADYSSIEARMLAQLGLRNHQLDTYAYAAADARFRRAVSAPANSGKTIQSFAAMLSEQSLAETRALWGVADYRRFGVIDVTSSRVWTNRASPTNPHCSSRSRKPHV